MGFRLAAGRYWLAKAFEIYLSFRAAKPQNVIALTEWGRAWAREMLPYKWPSNDDAAFCGFDKL